MELNNSEQVESNNSNYTFDKVIKDLDFFKEFCGGCMKIEDPNYSEDENKLYMAGYKHGIASFHRMAVRFLTNLKDTNVLKIME